MLRAQSLLPNLPQETLEFACDLVLEQICNYCNLTEAPDGLTNTAVLMVRGLVNSVQLQNENMQPAAKGVSRGDTSFSFATAAEQLAAAFAALHEHANKSLLDGLTQTDIDNWNGANVLTKDNTTPYEPRGEYQPATVRFVLDRVVAMGAADMQARVYDQQNRQADIFGEMDKTAAALRKEMAAVSEDARYIIDDVTGEKYRLGVSGGGLYYRKEGKA